ncbi:hypothetical protein WKW50_16475 [Ochrobactrum sp. GPK 3]
MTSDISKLNAYVALKPPSGAKASKLNAYAILKPKAVGPIPIVNTVFFTEDGPAPGWSPPASDKLLYWLRADAGVLNGDGQPAADGEKVGTWQSGGIKGPAIQSDEARRLTFKTGGANGQPYLQGSTADQTFFEDLDFTQPSGVTSINPFTAFVVSRNVDVSGYPAIIGSPATNGGKLGLYYRPDPNAQIHFCITAMRYGNYQSPSVLMVTHGRQANGTVTSPFANYWIRQNEADLYAAGYDSSNNVTTALTSMQFLRCSSLTTGGYFNGEVYEFLFYEGTLSDADTFAIEEHLALKYGTRSA